MRRSRRESCGGWIAVALATAVVLGAVPTLASDGGIPRDEAGFTENVARRLRAQVGATPVSVAGPLTLSIDTLTVNLDRVFNFCATGAAGCDREVSRLVEVVATQLAQRERPLQKASLRLVIREAGYVRSAEQSFGPDSPALVARPFVDGLVALAVADMPGSVRYLNAKDLAALGLSSTDAFALATANVRAELRPLAEKARPVQPGQIGIIQGTVYEVSRVAFHEDWAPLARAQGGKLIVAMPATDVVLYASEVTPMAVEALRLIAAEGLKRSPDPLSTRILAWSPEGWSVIR